MKYKAKFDPRVVSKYYVKALIGRGSFSHVVRVEHKGTGQQYAIKMIDVSMRVCVCACVRVCVCACVRVCVTENVWFRAPVCVR